MTTLSERILAAAARDRDASIAFLRTLIRAGRDGEAAVLDRVQIAMEAARCVVGVHDYAPATVPMKGEFASASAMDGEQRRCVTARRPPKGNGGRSLVFFAHPDSEPVTDPERWTNDPFAGSVENGRIHGWGVADDLAGVAIMAEAMRLFGENAPRDHGEVILACTPSKRHARGVSALLHSGLDADAAVYLHPAESGAGMGEVKAFCSGQLEFRVVVRGLPPPTTEPLQTAFAHLAVNPVHEALWLIDRMLRFGELRAERVRSKPLERTVGRSTNLMASHIAAGEPSKLARVPETCTVGFALAFPPSEDIADVRREVEEALAEAVAERPALRERPPEILWDAGVSGAEIPHDHPLFRATARAIRVATGRDPEVNPMHTGSDIRNPIVQRGIPTVGLGPLCGDLSQNGGHDEWVDAEDYLRAVAAAALLIAEWCAPDAAS